MSAPTIAVVDYGAGNIGSVLNMFKKISIPAIAASTPEAVAASDRLLLPGVGAFDYCVDRLDQSGLKPALIDAVLQKKRPILGICVGFQMLFRGSEEGSKPGLGWLDGQVARFDGARLSPKQKIPHMGWSELQLSAPNALFSGLDHPRYYFVHSYHPVLDEAKDALAECVYGYPFVCAAKKKNILGVQFHPEKSHRYGMGLLRNFAMLGEEFFYA